MSDAASTGAAGDGGANRAKPKDLRALVQEMGQWRHAPETGVNLVIVSVAAALPETKRTPSLIAQIAEGIAAIGAKRHGSTYQVSSCDLGIMAKVTETALIGLVRDLKVEMLRTIERNFPGSFGTIDQSRLVLSYDLVNNYRSAADRVAKYAELAQRSAADQEQGDKQLRPLTTGDIKNVMKAYEKFGNEKFIKAFVREQDIVMHVQGKPIERVLTEYFISMDLLRKPLFVDVEMRGSGRLFNEFTLVLDQILLQAFDHMHTKGGRCSINLNVESVFTEQFESFIERTPEAVLKEVVFEFRQSNIVENFDEFQVARGLIKSKGATIAVDQIFPQTVGLVDLDYIGASIAKIHWRNGAEDILKERERAVKYLIDCNVLPVLIRVDNERALEVGDRMGINLFQGFLIDDMLKKAAPAAS
ncbi:MAG: EAL domain-containing protein [Rhodospirillaceae bacterium]